MNENEVFNTFASFVKESWEDTLLPLVKEYEWGGCKADKTIENRRDWSDELNTAASSFEKEKILDDYIRHWGKIYTIKEERIREFVEIENIRKLLNQNKCISSASKALSLWRPKEYFIYDSRVAIALHKMWGMCSKVQDLKCPFILCPSRSEKAKAIIALLRENDKTRKVWRKRGSKRFYFDWYVRLISEVSEEYDKEYPEKVEMALFVCGKKNEKSEGKRECFKRK